MKSPIPMLAAALTMVCAAAVRAEQFTLTQAPTTLAEWKSSSFYKDGNAPTGAATDEIAVPCGLTVTVSDTQTDVIGFLNGIHNIFVNGHADKTRPQGKFVFDVAENATIEYRGRISSQAKWSSVYGKVEKAGKGALKLLNVESEAANSSWNVVEGELWLPPPDLSSIYDHYKEYGLVWIGPNGTVRTDACCSSFTDTVKQKQHSCHWRMSGLFNDGKIVNKAETSSSIQVCYNRIDPPDGTRQGTFSTGLSIAVKSGTLQMAGDANAFAGYPTVSGDDATHPARLAANAFGTKSGAASSIGTSTTAALINGTQGGALVYSGNGETSDKTLLFIAGDKTTVATSEINGGEHGGLILTGSFSYWSTSVGWIPHIIFGGDHASPCRFAGTMEDFVTHVYDGKTDYTYPRYLKKTGTGEWQFLENANFKTGATIEVADGTWVFESIADRGYNCSLGTATRCFSWEAVQPFDANRVDYAYVLGSTNGTEAGMMECRAAKVQQCTDRPFVLRGRGGFRASTAPVRFADVSGVGGGAKTLVLDGTLTAESEVHDIRNGDGIVSVEKTGSGTWVLGGDQTFSGSLAVKGGTLIVRRPAKDFRRYRLLIKEIIDNNKELLEKRGDTETGSTLQKYVSLCEVGLWAADNSRQNMNLSYNASYKCLAPGEFSIGGERTSPDLNYNNVCLLFDGCRYTSAESSYGNVWQCCFGRYSKNGVLQQAPRLGVPDSWIPIDMCLADGAKPIDHFDVMTGEENASRVAPSAVQLQASVDGIHWEDVSETGMLKDAAHIRYCWLSDNTYSDLKDTGLPPYDSSSSDFDHAGGWKTTKTESDKTFSLLENVGDVTVANGAVLKFEGTDAPAIKSLKLDASSGGTIDGFAFAESGTMSVEGASDASSFELPVDFTHASGLKNLENWSVTLSGSTKRRHLLVSGSRVTVCGNGLMLILR